MEHFSKELEVRLDYQPLFGKGARAPPPNVHRTRESGRNRAHRHSYKKYSLDEKKTNCVSSIYQNLIFVRNIEGNVVMRDSNTYSVQGYHF